MIRGEKIDLRVTREKDLEELFGFWSDIENRGTHFPIYLDSETKFREDFSKHGFWSEDEGSLLVVTKEDRILGEILFFKSVPYYDSVEIAYILFDKEARGKGAMSEALSLFVRFLFDSKKINRLELAIAPDHVPSKRVAEKCGFKSEGIARQAAFIKGEHQDMERYSLLREEVESIRQ